MHALHESLISAGVHFSDAKAIGTGRHADDPRSLAGWLEAGGRVAICLQNSLAMS